MKTFHSAVICFMVNRCFSSFYLVCDGVFMYQLLGEAFSGASIETFLQSILKMIDIKCNSGLPLIVFKVFFHYFTVAGTNFLSFDC